MIRATAAISSMNTPAELIRAISLTPNAFTSVENRISTLPSSTAFAAWSFLPLPSPTNWNQSSICGSVIWYASATADRVTMVAVIIIHPPSQPTCGPPIFLAQL